MTDQQMDAETQALVEAAIAEERALGAEAQAAHLQNRVIQLNVEVRKRDARVADLERELAEARVAGIVEERYPGEPAPEA